MANQRRTRQTLSNRDATEARPGAGRLAFLRVGRGRVSVGSRAPPGTAETPAADRVSRPLPCCPPKMEFLLGNPFSTPVGQCLGKAARRAGAWVGDGDG